MYGPDALESQNIKEFKNLLDVNRESDKTSRMMEIYTFAKDCNLSAEKGDKLLKLLNHNNDQKEYTSWRTFDRWILKETDFYESVKKILDGFFTGK